MNSFDAKRVFRRIVVCSLALAAQAACGVPRIHAQFDSDEHLFDVPPVVSTWDDLLEGVESPSDWERRKSEIRRQFLELLRDEHKPDRPELDLRVHELTVVDGVYERRLISYQVEEDERAHAYLGIPIGVDSRQLAAVVALHGTFAQGKDRAAGLVDNPDKAYLDHLCRRGYVVIAPDHFVAGHRIPAEGAYDTSAFHRKHPNWTAVGKFTYEHSIAVDVLQSLPEVDPDRIGAMGHSLGGQGTIFLAAYDKRIKAAACNCSFAMFRHNRGVLNWSRDRWYVYIQHLRDGLLEQRMPEIDFHHMIALVAPRAYMDVMAINDGAPDTQRQRVLMLMKVMQVYDLEDASDQFSYYIHGQGHSVPHVSRELIYGFFDAAFYPERTETHLLEE